MKDIRLFNVTKHLPYVIGGAVVLVAITVVAFSSVAGQGLLIGQEHSYDVYVRGNGEALVAARVVVNNTQQERITEVTLKAPEGVRMSELRAAQEVRSPVCRNERRYFDDDEECQEFRPPDYSQKHYRFQPDPKFQRISTEVTNGITTINLKKAIAPGNNGAFLLSFVTRDFVEPTLGDAYTFNAQSLRAEQRITEAKMAVYADTDYRIRGAESDVNYASAPEKTSGLQSATADQAQENSALKKFSRSVGKQGQVDKTARALSPGDVMEIKGFAAQNWWRLHLTKLVVIGLVLAGVIAGLTYWWRRSAGQNGHGGNTTNQKPSDTAATTSAVFGQKQPEHSYKAPARSRLYIISILLGLVSALAVIGVTAILLNTEAIIDHGQALLSMLKVLAVSAAYLLAFLIPPVFAGMRWGLRWGFAAAGAGLVWMILIALLVSVLFANIDNDKPRTAPVPGRPVRTPF